MAKTQSFDVTTGVDLQEVDNAANQARKEIARRYDFKGTHCEIAFDREVASIQLEGDDEYRVQVQVQGEALRVSSPSRHALQEVVAFLRGEDFGVELQFGNYR